MKLIAKIALAVVANAAGLMAAAYFVPGFDLRVGVLSLGTIALALTLLNLVVKPVLKLFLSPIIILTLGLGLIFVNAIILYILDILFPNLTIETVTALVYSAIIIGLVNFVFHLATKE